MVRKESFNTIDYLIQIDFYLFTQDRVILRKLLVGFRQITHNDSVYQCQLLTTFKLSVCNYYMFKYVFLFWFFDVRIVQIILSIVKSWQLHKSVFMTYIFDGILVTLSIVFDQFSGNTFLEMLLLFKVGCW